MRVFVHCDNTFRDIDLITEKLKFLSTDDEEPINTISFMYGLNYKKLNNGLSNLNVTLIRRSNIDDCFAFADAIFLFHNFIEYNNGMTSLIKNSLLESLPVIIYADHNAGLPLINVDNKLKISDTIPSIDRHNHCCQYKIQNYVPLKLSRETNIQFTKKLLKVVYQEYEQEKQENSIHLLSLA
jgi:hypothetical protein